MAPQEHLFKLMNLKPETYDAAIALFINVQARTAPGSGYNLGPLSTGLPAVCAYFASQQLRNNDLSEKVAQQSSCLNQKDFAKTLTIVRTVLSTNNSDPIPESPTKKRRIAVTSPPKKNLPTSPRQVSARLSVSHPDPISESPTKKHRITVTTPPPKMILRASPRQVSAQLSVSHPSHTPTEEVSAAGLDDDEPESDLPHRRRFRPVFLDHAQWYARDPRLDREWKNANAHSGPMV